MSHLKRPGIWLGALAVALAMSGSAYAASKITGAQIKDGTITGRDIKNHSLSASKLSSLRSLHGPAGPAGPAGAAGPAGPAGPSVVGASTPVNSVQVPFTDYAAAATASCPAGQRVLSGGGVSISPYGMVASEANISRTGWVVIGGTPDYTLVGQYVQAYAICAPANAAVAASVGAKAHNTAKDRAQISRIVARVNAFARRGH